jgi:solute carrier family 35, member F5
VLNENEQSASNSTADLLRRTSYDSILPAEEPELEVPVLEDNDKPLSFADTAKLSLQFCWLWFLANFCNNLSYSMTLVSSTTILASTSSLWALLIGLWFKIEHFSFSRLVSVLLSIIGVTLVSTAKSKREADGSSPKHNDLIGNLLSLLSAFVYAYYVSVLSYKIKSEKRVSMMLFFGLVGMFNFLLLWPLFFMLDAIGLEKFKWPSNSNTWLLLLLNGLLGTFLSEFLWLKATLLTSALISTMGLCLMTPMVIVVDLFMGLGINFEYFFGGGLVVTGFVVVNLSNLYKEYDSMVDRKVSKFLRSFLARREPEAASID